MICYDLNPPRADNSKPFDPTRCDAVKLWAGHFRNSLTLTFFLQNGTTREKHDASKELEVCERKMKYWERQPGFDRHAAQLAAAEIKRSWR
jgi:hypothetical protein